MNRVIHNIYPVIIFFLSLILVLFTDPEILREKAPSYLMIFTIVMVPYNLITAESSSEIPNEGLHLILLAFCCIVISSVFWFRASLGSYGFESGFGLRIGKRLFFWLPAVVFTCFHRMPGERWHPKGRMNFIKRLLIASMSGLAGLLIQGIVQEIL
jgi:hypothetical protein